MKKSNIPLYQLIYQDIKDKIHKKEYKKNTKLESVRALAKRLDISTTTIEKAYNQLLIEGFVKSIPRSGYFVVDVHNVPIKTSNKLIIPINYNRFINNKLTLDLFDVKSYKSIVNKVLNYDSEELFAECDPRGEEVLREEIRKYVLTERDVECDINQIIVGPGIQSLLNILLSLQQFKSVTYLNPEFKKAMTVFNTFNYSFKPRSSIKEICRLKADYLYISPSNIYPTGEVLKAKDRNDIIKWAKENNSYIIEDDYNYFIRYNSYTIPSIHSYDSERVIYMGSFSKTIIPSIRISFMILPISLYDIYKEVFDQHSQGVSKLNQLSLALFMKEGLFKRHTKKLYNLYKEKNEILASSLDKYVLNGSVNIRGTESNLHVILDFKNKKSLNHFTSNCDALFLKYEIIDNLTSVIFPYSGIENNNIKKLVEKLFANI